MAVELCPIKEVSVLKIRIKFQKNGSMKFIGHLDIMRYFQKAIRRAEIDVAFSTGFSPHMIMSFAAPLGVGLTSDGEYVDIEINSSISSKEAVSRLNAVMAEGMKVVSFRQISEEKKKTAMSIVAAADYEVRFRPGYEPEADSNWQNQLQEFYQKDSITILKKTKKSELEVDILPMIYELRMNSDQTTIFMQLATGSVQNLKPELVMEAFADYAGLTLKPFAIEVHRKEIYADLGDEDKKVLVSLESLGEEIEG